MSDPRIGSVVSVTKAETTADLKFCKVFVSMLGEKPTQAEAMTALKKAAGFVRRRVAETINLRNTPELTFVFDDSIEYGMRMTRLIEHVNREVSHGSHS
jgi:ribosome-binding factor A